MIAVRATTLRSGFEMANTAALPALLRDDGNRLLGAERNLAPCRNLELVTLRGHHGARAEHGASEGPDHSALRILADDLAEHRACGGAAEDHKSVTLGRAPRDHLAFGVRHSRAQALLAVHGLDRRERELHRSTVLFRAGLARTRQLGDFSP